MREIPFEKENLQIFENETEIYKGDFEKKMACLTAMEMMNDCLNYIYQLLHPMYPKVYKPRIYLADKNEPNAFAQPTGEADGYIVVFSGLIFSFLNLIEEKYTEDVLKKYKIFEGIPQEEVLSGIRVYFWRYIVLHELYHLWHRHGLWKSLYEFDDNEKVIKMKSELTNFAQGERVEQLKDNSPDARRNMTQQALELDADSSAFCMLVNMLMRDTKQRGLYVEQRNSYIKNEIGFLMAALASAYSLFDNRSGARFEILKSLKECSHPIPAIRMYYAEEIVEGSLKRFFESEEEFEIIESEWLKVVCDVEAEHKGNIAQGNVFYYPAFTECAQEHLSELKHYMIEMYETLQPLSLSNFAEKLENEDAEIQTEAIWFTETGVGLRTWMKSKNNHRRVKKPGVNALCPCGSGKKFKKCCRGNGRYD